MCVCVCVYVQPYQSHIWSHWAAGDTPGLVCWRRSHRRTPCSWGWKRTSPLYWSNARGRARPDTRGDRLHVELSLVYKWRYKFILIIEIVGSQMYIQEENSKHYGRISVFIVKRYFSLSIILYLCECTLDATDVRKCWATWAGRMFSRRIWNNINTKKL